MSYINLIEVLGDESIYIHQSKQTIKKTSLVYFSTVKLRQVITQFGKSCKVSDRWLNDSLPVLGPLTYTLSKHPPLI